MDNRQKFENFMIMRNDVLDNETMDLIRLFANDKNLEHDMELVGEVQSAIEGALYRRNIGKCHPFLVDPLCGGDCNECANTDCQNNPDCEGFTAKEEDADDDWIPCINVLEEDYDEHFGTNSHGCNKNNCPYRIMESKEDKKEKEVVI